MPIYLYECEACEDTFKIRHGMSETCEECAECGSPNVSRIPTNVINSSKSLKKSKKVGDTTKEFIENAKHDLKMQKEDLGKQR